MTVADKRELIKNTLAESADTPNFAQAATKLLNILGYESPDALDMSAKEFTESAKDFIAQYPSLTNTPPGTKSEKELIKAVKSIRIIFEYGEQEFRPGLPGINAGNTNHDFVFIAVELKDVDYPRSKYVALAREINKRFLRLTVVLFRANKSLNMAFFDRRPHKKDEDRDVLQKVSLLSDIDCQNPHTGHLDILAELSLDERVAWINSERKPQSIDGLRMAWLDTLNVDVLNKRFYCELLTWFNLAGNVIKLPKELRLKSDKWRIRLITRMLFIWFIKENRLIADELFNKEDIKTYLKKFDNENGDSYYRAVLQNLFFAVLNTPINERKFNTQARHDFYLYRYKNEIVKPDQLLKLFAKTPFINGGLFDCLDDYENTSRDNELIDYFSDEKGKKLSVPDKLFFGEGGLIPLFKKYKFTVHENTPVEQEVALDPELLGKTFENLLAAHTLETQENARKQTGSYYTPREIVDYMTAESLTESLFAKISGGQIKREQIRALFDYDDSEDDSTKPKFEKTISKRLIRDIANIKIFDPAVGSGAFPMSALHLLLLALSKLDPKNNEWKKLPKNQAQKDIIRTFDKTTDPRRKKQLLEFERKLYLIQNSIFGADIQPIACQIAKLRFFISLAIEQTPNIKAKNYGIKPLPNLETRIVAADTLIALIEDKTNIMLGEKETNLKKAEIMRNRERYFNASNRKDKFRFIEQDKKLRRELKEQLIQQGFPNENADKIAEWDPYNPNAPAADWFDAEYMFDIANGFDIVIGNPPYVDSENMKNSRPEYRSMLAKNYESASGNWDLYVPFIEQGLNFAQNGILSFIVPNKLLSQPYAKTIRNIMASRHIIEIRDYSHLKVFEASVCPVTFTVSRNDTHTHTNMIVMKTLTDVDFCNCVSINVFSQKNEWSVYFVPGEAFNILEKINAIETKALGQFANPASVSEAYIIKDFVIDAESAPDTKKMINSGTIDRYISYWGHKKMKYLGNKYLFPRAREADIMSLSPKRIKESSAPKLILANMTKFLEACPDIQANYIAGKTTVIYISHKSDLYVMLALLNSKLLSFWYAKTFHATKMGPGLQITSNFLSQIPIPAISDANSKSLIELAKKITAAKQANPDANTTADEEKIDRLAYKIYGLAEEEIKIVESLISVPPKK